ncbi:hypothetical protein M0805_005568 [Coniferiporia weirii]|nr:hypothetical protein M0805_005568 [Coniferiporia weirii]
MFIILRDMSSGLSGSSPWLSLGPRRFGGDAYERLITLQHDASPEDEPPISVNVKFLEKDLYDVTVNTSSSRTEFASVSARLPSRTSILSTLSGQQLRTTIVAQPPAPTTPATAHTGERLHIFHGAQRSTLRIPPPRWLQALGEGVLAAATGGGSVRAPMPSLVVDVRVSAGDTVTAGQALVVLESMKTETVLRASAAGVVRGVACAKGEMVEEGKELVNIELNTGVSGPE